MTILHDHEDFTRRAFLAGTGYALAVSPVTAWAITTSNAGLETADVKVPTGGDVMPAYFARPKRADVYPVVFVIHEIFGVHEYIRDVCRRLADEGYFAIAPDLFFRHGDATKIADRDKLRKDIVDKATLTQEMSDLDALAKWLEGQKAADPKRLAVTGFCWGGNVAWMLASHRHDMKAAVAWYGKLSGEKTLSQPSFPLDVAATLTVPVLGLYGEKDQGIPQDQVLSMRATLAKGKSGSKIIVYPGAEHAFHADYRPSYNEAAAKAGWTELLSWFTANGMGAKK